MKRNWARAACAIIVVSLTGCFGFRSGQKFDDHSVKNIRSGKTTKSEVLQMFGQPPTRNSSGGGKETWMYSYHDTRSRVTAATYIPIVGMFVGGAKVNTNRQTLTIEFSESIVSNCQYNKSSSDGKATSAGLGMSVDPGQNRSVSLPCEEFE